MVTKSILRGKQVLLRQIEMTDCGEKYVSWLNDPEVNQHLETRWSLQNEDRIRDFVRGQRENDHSYLFAMIDPDTQNHIGNIKIGPVHPQYHHADISYFIGDKSYWHRGIATEAIALICRFGFEELNLHRIEAGAYETAQGSWRALEKNGFVREGTFRDLARDKDQYVNVYRYGLLVNEYEERQGKRT